MAWVAGKLVGPHCQIMDTVFWPTPGVLGHGVVQAVDTRRGGGHSHATCGPGIALGMTMQAYVGTAVTAQPTLYVDHPMYAPVRRAGGQQGGVPWSPGQNQVLWLDLPALPLRLVGRLMALRQQQPQGAHRTQRSPREEAQLGPHLGP